MPLDFTFWIHLIMLLILMGMKNKVIVWRRSSYFLNTLFDQQSNFKNDFPKLNHFYAQPNKWHLRKVGRYSSWNIVSTNIYKDEVNSLKNHNQNNTHQAISQKFKQIVVVCVGGDKWVHTFCKCRWKWMK